MVGFLNYLLNQNNQVRLLIRVEMPIKIVALADFYPES